MPEHDILKEVFQRNLKRLLAQKQTTQKDLAEYMKVSPVTVNDWVRGRKLPRMDKVDRLCEYFNVPRSALMEKFSNSTQAPTPVPDDLPTFSPTGQKIDARTRRQLEAVLDDDNLTYNGVVLDGEDKEKVKKALELIFWDVKEKNKRKKN